MTTYSKKISVSRRHPLVENLLLIEGISRAGKFLLNNLLAGIEGIEPGQCRASLENIPRLVSFGLLDKTAGQELIQTEIDQYCYEMLIGRNAFNYRESDKSSIFNNPRHQSYFKRYTSPDGESAVQNFYQEKLYSSFIVHETLPNIKIFIDHFPKIKVLSIQRNPVALIHSWLKRNLEKRIGADPIMGAMIFRHNRILVPWYLRDKAAEYKMLNNETDRVILAVSAIISKNRHAFKKLSPSAKRRIIFINYEDLMTKPELIMPKVAQFLHKKTTPDLPKIIKAEKLPNPEASDIDGKKVFLFETASPIYRRLLAKLESDYTHKNIFS